MTQIRIRSLCGAIDRQAVVDTVPLLLGALPFALVVGLTATQSKIPTLIAWLSSPLVFAGAAQLTLLTLAGSASVVSVFVAIATVNARHVMYSAALAPEMSRHPAWFRWLGAAFLIDQNFATATTAVGGEPAQFRRYYLTSTFILYSGWCVTTAIGTIVGTAVPTGWRLEFTIPVLFVAMTVSAIKRKQHGVAAAVGAIVGIATSGLADRIGIVLGAASGVAAGLIADHFWKGEPKLKDSK